MPPIITKQLTEHSDGFTLSATALTNSDTPIILTIATYRPSTSQMVHLSRDQAGALLKVLLGAVEAYDNAALATPEAA